MNAWHAPDRYGVGEPDWPPLDEHRDRADRVFENLPDNWPEYKDDPAAVEEPRQ